MMHRYTPRPRVVHESSSATLSSTSVGLIMQKNIYFGGSRILIYFSKQTTKSLLKESVRVSSSSLFTTIIFSRKQNSWLHCHCFGLNPLGLISNDQIHNYIYFPSTRAYNWGTLTLWNFSLEKPEV